MYDENLMDRIRRRVAAMPQDHMLCDQMLELAGVEHDELLQHAKLLIDLGEIDAKIIGPDNARAVFARKLNEQGWARLLRFNIGLRVDRANAKPETVCRARKGT
ncbi:MAG: hypothetical protein WA979_10330 [Pacificimonas sp.]